MDPTFTPNPFVSQEPKGEPSNPFSLTPWKEPALVLKEYGLKIEDVVQLPPENELGEMYKLHPHTAAVMQALGIKAEDLDWRITDVVPAFNGPGHVAWISATYWVGSSGSPYTANGEQITFKRPIPVDKLKVNRPSGPPPVFGNTTDQDRPS